MLAWHQNNEEFSLVFNEAIRIPNSFQPIPKCPWSTDTNNTHINTILNFHINTDTVIKLHTDTNTNTKRYS